MPTYTFECPNCGDRINILRGMEDNSPLHCNKCRVDMNQVITGGAMARVVRSESAFNGIGNFDMGKYEEKRYGKSNEGSVAKAVDGEMKRWSSMADDVARDKAAHIRKWGW